VGASGAVSDGRLGRRRGPWEWTAMRRRLPQSLPGWRARRRSGGLARGNVGRGVRHVLFHCARVYREPFCFATGRHGPCRGTRIRRRRELTPAWLLCRPVVAKPPAHRYTELRRFIRAAGLMTSSVNTLKNPDLSRGRAEPTGWRWRPGSGDVRWERVPGPAERGLEVEVRSMRRPADGFFEQSFRCRPDRFYHLEATVCCDVQADGESSGALLRVEAPGSASPVASRSTPGLHRCPTSTIIRAYYQAPPDAGTLRVSVGLCRARGWLRIQRVRAFEILAPEEGSHPLAIPPPPVGLRPPVVARNVCVCAEDAQERPVTALLRRYFGDAG